MSLQLPARDHGGSRRWRRIEQDREQQPRIFDALDGVLIAALQIDPIASAERNIRWSQRDPTFQAMQRQITGNMMWRYGRSRGNDEVNGLEPVGFDQRGQIGRAHV